MQTPLAVIGATAPIRICDNGGWTDTWVARRGKVFNIAVRPSVMARIDVFRQGVRSARVAINAENYGVRYAPVLDGERWGPHPLLEAAVRAIPPPEDADVEITIRSTVPPGASTGTSAAVVVALLGALNRLAGGRRTAAEIASQAHAVETIQVGRQCGIQDQLCSAIGGVNFIEITDYPRATVTSLTLPESTLREFDRRLGLVYLGRPHSSSAVHERVLVELKRLGPDCPQLDALRVAAEHARDAALAGDFEAFGRAMRMNTDAQARLHPDLVGPEARRIIEIAGAHGAVGWKVNGAGGDGGSLTILCGARPDSRQAMIRAMRQESAAVTWVPIAISSEGLRTWSAPGA